MKFLYSKFTLIPFACAFLLMSVTTTASAQDSTKSRVYFDLDACYADFSNGSNAMYSEFTADISNSPDCAALEVVGGHLYRTSPQVNTHSCTPGVGDSRAMCISSDASCTYSAGSQKSVRIDINVIPGGNGSGSLSSLMFYEQAPDEFVWINGASGPNNYPTMFAVRVLKNGTEIYVSSDNATQPAWNVRMFDFSGNPEFTVTEATVFNIELLGYCPVGNGATVSAWDLDEITITSDCCPELDGGELSGGPFEFCVGDGIADNVSGVTLSGNVGTNSQYVVTDEMGTILGLPPTPEAVDFDGAGGGTCLIWHLSFEDGLSGAELGNNAMTDLIGCYDLSNPVTVVRNQPAGGELSGGPFEFCVGDGIPDNVSGVTLSGDSGSNSQYVVTDTLGTILGLPPSPEAVDFDGAGTGVCLIWHLSFEDGLTGAELGANAGDLEGCFSLSNPIIVYRNQPVGGELSGGPFTFCVGDGVPDNVSGVTLTGNSGSNSQYVVTDTNGVILGLPPSPEAVDFDGAGGGVCLIWHLSFEDGLTGAELGANAGDLEGCYSLSNPVVVNRVQPMGGVLEGGPFEFCVGDGIPDNVSGVTLSGNSGSNSQYVVTDTNGVILGLPPSPEAVDFDGAGDGVCLIWHLSFEDGLTGAELGANAADLEGCFSLSNPVTVNRNQPMGGELSGGPFTFCVGDGVPDNVSGVTLSGNSGANSQYVVTDTNGVILGLPPSPEAVDFDGAGTGVCLIWHLSFEDGLTGAELGANAADLEGCFSLSNPVVVNRVQPMGGILEGGPFEFCVGDGIPDNVSGVTLSGNSGSNSQYVVTDTNGVILGLPPSPEAVDFDGAGDGVCLIWHLSFEDGLSGAELGANAADLEGCFSLSNPVTVYRNQPMGGELSGGPFTFCVGDGVPDNVSGVTLTGASGSNSQYVVTDTLGNILGLPPTPEAVDFDGAGTGVCLIWHLSFEDGLTGAEVGANAADLEGCFSLSNPVVVNRAQPAGGELSGGPFTFCVGDGVPDNVSGVTLTGASGSNSQYVVTDTNGVILGLPPTPEAVDFDGAGGGVCLIWHLSFEDGLMGAELGANAGDLEGCYSLSNPVVVNRVQPVGGELSGGPFTFCVGDGMPDNVSGVTLTGASGSNSQYVVTDTNGVILGLPPTPEAVDFDGAGDGVCLIWHLSFEDGLTGAELGANAADLMGCFSLSNPITVIRNQPDGGELTGGPFEFCVGDSMPDMVSGVTLMGNSGGNSQYVVTDTNGVILGLPPTPEAVDFDGAGGGVCLIWHLSFEDGLTGAELGANAGDLQGCYDLSNPITVVRIPFGECTVAPGPGEMEFDMSIYPNPARDVIQVGLNYSGEDVIEVEVFDALGKLTLTRTIYTLEGDQPLDVSRLDSGQYFLRMRTRTGHATKSFIILR